MELNLWSYLFYVFILKTFVFVLDKERQKIEEENAKLDLELKEAQAKLADVTQGMSEGRKQ